MNKEKTFRKFNKKKRLEIMGSLYFRKPMGDYLTLEEISFKFAERMTAVSFQIRVYLKLLASKKSKPSVGNLRLRKRNTNPMISYIKEIIRLFFHIENDLTNSGTINLEIVNLNFLFQKKIIESRNIRNVFPYIPYLISSSFFKFSFSEASRKSFLK